MSSVRQELLTLIREKALVSGDVVLSAGETANLYVDLRQVSLDPRGSWYLGQVMLDLTHDWDFDAVGGLTMGADPIAFAMMHRAYREPRDLSAFVVRDELKPHGLQRLIEGPEVSGRRVVVVEDTTTTGRSIGQAIDVVRRTGAHVAGIAVVVDRSQGLLSDATFGCPYRHLFTLGDLVG